MEISPYDFAIIFIATSKMGGFRNIVIDIDFKTSIVYIYTLCIYNWVE